MAGIWQNAAEPLMAMEAGLPEGVQVEVLFKLHRILHFQLPQLPQTTKYLGSLPSTLKLVLDKQLIVSNHLAGQTKAIFPKLRVTNKLASLRLLPNLSL